MIFSENEQEHEKHLESLADKGVVFAREKDGEWGYAHVNTFHLFENPYRKGVHETCIGCGICAAGCPNDAIRMERQRDFPEPPTDIMEYGMQLLQEQGKLEAFIDVSTPKAE